MSSNMVKISIWSTLSPISQFCHEKNFGMSSFKATHPKSIFLPQEKVDFCSKSKNSIQILGVKFLKELIPVL